MDCSLPGSSVHWVLQARILKRVAISYAMESSQARDQTKISCISCIGRWILCLCITWEAKALDNLLIWLTFAFTYEIVPVLNSLQITLPECIMDCPVGNWEMWIQSLGQEDLLEEGTTTHSSILAWRIQWTEEPGKLQSIGLLRAGHDWSDLAWISGRTNYSSVKKYSLIL